jgi:hypothetical protein
MKRLETMRALPVAVLLALTAVPAWAAERVQKSGGQRLVEEIVPIIILCGLLWFFLRRACRRNEPYMERAKVHMERIEQQNAEIIGLLRDIAGKKAEPDQAGSR